MGTQKSEKTPGFLPTNETGSLDPNTPKRRTFLPKDSSGASISRLISLKGLPKYF